MEECYRFRWCRLLGNPTPGKLAFSAATQLKWIGKRLPSRVHLANVRFHFNGWHTARRYQRRHGSSCPFCKNESAEDSIEHFVYCPAVHGLFPESWKSGNPPRIPLRNLFLFGLSGEQRLAVALIMYALYSVHNEYRHSNHRHDFKNTVFRIIAEVYLQPRLKPVLNMLVSWHQGPWARTPCAAPADHVSTM